MGQLSWLGDNELTFPDTSRALDDPNGLLAIGGDLSHARLLAAYSQGIFPWYNDGQPILWWSPSPRMMLEPSQLHISRSIKKLMRKKPFSIRVDTAFEEVVNICSSVERDGQDGTWITREIADAYKNMHRLGYAHSVEAWQNNTLVGGLYGIALGRAFFGESMFSLISGASKVSFVCLTKQLESWEYKLLDCQIHTEHLKSFGAYEVSRCEFEKQLKSAVSDKGITNWPEAWTIPEFGVD